MKVGLSANLVGAFLCFSFDITFNDGHSPITGKASTSQPKLCVAVFYENN